MIEIRNVTKKYDDIVAVNDINLEIKENEFFSLVGPSGCGKTTTLRMVAGLENPTEGEIFIKGEKVNGVPPYKRDTNLVFQDLALFPHMNVYENIAFGLREKDTPEEEISEKIENILEITGISGYEERNIGNLSGGEQQRVATARGLVNDPAVLLLDEPLGPLDRKLRFQMQEYLKNLQSELGTTFLYVTHDQKEALNMSDRIALMQNGDVKQVSTPTDLYMKPESKFTAEFIGNSNIFEGKYKEGEIKVEDLSIKTKGLDFEDNSPVGVVLKPEQIQIGENLEDLDNIIEGKIENVSFYGESIEYMVKIKLNNKEKKINIDIEHTGSDKLISSGEKIKIGWNAEDSRIYRKTSE